jgi:hypothetical protein
MEDEVVGEERLNILADLIYGDRDPSAVFFKEKPYEFIEEGDGYIVKPQKSLFEQRGSVCYKERRRDCGALEKLQKPHNAPKKVKGLRAGGCQAGGWLFKDQA